MKRKRTEQVEEEEKKNQRDPIMDHLLRHLPRVVAQLVVRYNEWDPITNHLLCHLPRVLAQLVAQYNERVPMPAPVFNKQPDPFLDFLVSPDIQPQTGMVGICRLNRGELLDPFVVIRIHELDKQLFSTSKSYQHPLRVYDVIFPRMQFDAYGPLRFGVDASTEDKFILPFDCICEGELHPGWDCSCGSDEKNRQAYESTFQEAPPGYVYQVWTIISSEFGGPVFPTQERLQEYFRFKPLQTEMVFQMGPMVPDPPPIVLS